jgi:uncharacterized protein (DUF58 family)
MQGEIAHHEILDSRQFHLAVKRLADSLNYGTDRSPFLGSGLEFVQSRLYEPGDSVRSIDWRVTARTRKLHVKQYEAPRRMPVYLLVDTSASMTIASSHRSKYEMAVFLAGGLALAALDRISPVGVIGVGSRGLHVEPSLSKDQVLQWLHRLRTYRYDEDTRLSARLRELVPRLPHRVLIIILSDLHDPEAHAALKRARQRHDIAVLQLRDPAESQLRGIGFVRAQEAETGRAFLAHGRSTWLDQARIDADMKRAGIDHMRVDTDQPVTSRLRQFFRARDLLGRGAR